MIERFAEMSLAIWVRAGAAPGLAEIRRDRSMFGRGGRWQRRSASSDRVGWQGDVREGDALAGRGWDGDVLAGRGWDGDVP